MESTESRFAHLLQPIRELTKNWDVDIASELNDYLEELDEMCITFDDGEIKLNFAEAALLIQGSVCIYSRKVELLHNLVYRTLEYINEKNKKKNKQVAESEENNAEEVHNHDDNDAEFTDIEINPSNYNQTSDFSSAVNDIPLPPECLIPQDTGAKHKLPLITLKGEILFSQKDFRLITIIPENDIILLALATAESRELMEDNQCPAADFAARQPQLNDDAPVCAEADANDDAAEDNFLPLADNDGGMEVDHGTEEHIERHQAPSEGRMIRERRQIEAIKPREELPPEVNVWALHDPYTAIEEEKPFKSGKCYKVPEGLDDGGKRKRKRTSVLQDFESWFRGISDPLAHKLKNGPTSVDLNYIYLTTVKDKLRSKKRIYRKAGVAISEEELRQTLLQPEDTDEQRQGEDIVDHPGFLGYDNDNSDNEHEEFPDDVPADFGVGPDFILPESQKDELTYEQLVKLRVEQLVVNSRGYTQETALSRKIKEWEDKIKPELALQEERPAFDIHDYGDRIVNALDSVGQHRSFSSIVSGLDNFEVCKYFLASLQLANDYTVEIDSLAGLEKNVDSVGLTLLSVQRATERFKNL
ncbi:hypothetical protein WMY93_022064 [Mugilogobius chulae]|uniref:Condensin-2 complex subunit H2 n=1 Tax=Mugilogobius chulae TaxID=88201 RepID=A0AAW0NNL2_9GOBI